MGWYQSLSIFSIVIDSFIVREWWGLKQNKTKNIWVPGRVWIPVPQQTMGTWASFGSLPLSSYPQRYITSQVTWTTATLSNQCQQPFSPIGHFSNRWKRNQPININVVGDVSPEVFTFKINLPVTACGSLLAHVVIDVGKALLLSYKIYRVINKEIM